MEEVPAPKKLAPYSAALSAETVETVGATPVATGRFVVLHDPDGQEAWDGDFRIVVQARARIDDEIGMDSKTGSMPIASTMRSAWTPSSSPPPGAGSPTALRTPAPATTRW